LSGIEDRTRRGVRERILSGIEDLTGNLKLCGIEDQTTRAGFGVLIRYRRPKKKGRWDEENPGVSKTGQEMQNVWNPNPR
jgi:hypothetical protein